MVVQFFPQGLMFGSQAAQRCLGRRQGPSCLGPPWPSASSPDICLSIPKSCQASSASCLDALRADPQTSAQHSLSDLAAGGGDRLMPLQSFGLEAPTGQLREATQSRGAAPAPIASNLPPHAVTLGLLQPNPLSQKIIYPSPNQHTREATNIACGHRALRCQCSLVLPGSCSLHQAVS